MTKEDAIVAVYNSHQEAEEAVSLLQRAGFDLKKLSIVGKDYHTEENVVGYYNTGDRMKYWGSMGAFWGAIWGLLFGAAFFVVPGIGPVLVAGPLTAAIVAALEGAVAVGGLSAIGAGLFSIGIPKDSVIRYDVALKADKFLLIVHGTAEEIAKAKEIIQANFARGVERSSCRASTTGAGGIAGNKRGPDWRWPSLSSSNSGHSPEASIALHRALESSRNGRCSGDADRSCLIENFRRERKTGALPPTGGLDWQTNEPLFGSSL